MTAQIIDESGHMAWLKEEHGITPGLAVVVGDDPASEVYVRDKGGQSPDI
ncbi:hypothetical protein [Mesorhizobium sp.]